MNEPRTFCFSVLSWRVIDGDSVEVELDRGWNDVSTRILRLYGVDAPELRQIEQREAAEVVKAAVEEWCIEASEESGILMAHSVKLDKFAGRIDGDLFLLGSEKPSLVTWLRDKGLVRQYDGGARKPWPAETLKEIVDTARK